MLGGDAPNSAIVLPRQGQNSPIITGNLFTFREPDFAGSSVANNGRLSSVLPQGATGVSLVLVNQDHGQPHTVVKVVHVQTMVQTYQIVEEAHNYDLKGPDIPS